jgi:hypothetical protein
VHLESKMVSHPPNLSLVPKDQIWLFGQHKKEIACLINFGNLLDFSRFSKGTMQ